MKEKTLPDPHPDGPRGVYNKAQKAAEMRLYRKRRKILKGK